MTDPRLTPANDRVAAEELRGQIDGVTFVAGEAASVAVQVADLCTAPAGPRTRQCLLGASLRVLERRDGWAFVQGVDGYVGYVALSDLAAPVTPTHCVVVRATHGYAAPDIKTAGAAPVYLPFGTAVAVTDWQNGFGRTDQGWVPAVHLRDAALHESDPAAIAELHLGVPYLWGGNSMLGIDCSGLIAAALQACGITCPGDSDLQQAALGRDATGDPRRGDLVFWQGHVGMMTDDRTLIHANAHAMAVALEPIDAAIARIAAQGDGPVLRRARLG